MNKNLANKIVQIRKEHGMTQDEFASKLFVTRQAISRWETGETSPSIDTIEKIIEIFNIDANFFFSKSAIETSKQIIIQDTEKPRINKVAYYTAKKLFLLIMCVFSFTIPFFNLYGFHSYTYSGFISYSSGAYKHNGFYLIIEIGSGDVCAEYICGIILCAFILITAIFGIVFATKLLSSKTLISKARFKIVNILVVSQFIYAILYMIVGITIYDRNENSATISDFVFSLLISAIILTLFYIIPHIIKSNRDIKE